MPDSAIADTFLIRLPDSWQEVPLERDELREMLARASADLPDDTDPLAVRRFGLMLERNLEIARSAGLAFAAAYFEPLDPEEIVAELGPAAADDPANLLSALMATVGIVANHAAEFGAEQLTMAALDAAAELGGRSTVPLREAEEVELNGRPALHEVLISTVAGDGQEVPVLVDRYLILINDGADLVTVQFMTPSIPVIDEFGDLFRAMVETLEFVAA